MKYICLYSVFVFAALIFQGTTLKAQNSRLGTGSPTRTFGPYEVLVLNSTIVADVKVNKNGDIYLMLQPDYLGLQITIKSSMQKGPPYRKWFNGQEEWVAHQNTTGREAGVWSDRLQTTANYVEYWAGGQCFLHLKRMDNDSQKLVNTGSDKAKDKGTDKAKDRDKTKDNRTDK